MGEDGLYCVLDTFDRGNERRHGGVLEPLLCCQGRMLSLSTLVVVQLSTKSRD
jgi:hypothetical protein